MRFYATIDMGFIIEARFVDWILGMRGLESSVETGLKPRGDRGYIRRLDSEVKVSMTWNVPEGTRDQDGPARAGKVLVVEDDPLLRRVLVKILQTWGYAILEAPDGLSALEQARADGNDVRVILLDIMLPLLNGLEVARHLRVERPGLPIVACSAALTDEVKDDLTRMGVERFLHKPYTPESLRLLLQELLDQGPGLC